MKETNINDLTTRLTDEESNIVDSIPYEIVIAVSEC